MIQPVMVRLRQVVDDKSEMNEITKLMFRFLYLLTKTRGFKTIGMSEIDDMTCGY